MSGPRMNGSRCWWLRSKRGMCLQKFILFSALNFDQLISEVSFVCLRILAACRSTEIRTDLFIRDPMGKKYYTRRTPRVFTFVVVSAAAAPSPVLGNIPPNDGMPGGPIPPGFFQGPPGSQPSPHAQPPPHNPNSMMGPHSQPFMSPRYAGGPRPPIRMGNQPPGGVPGTQPLLPNSMDPTRQQGHPNMGGPMQRMNPPRGMGPMGPGPQTDPWLSLQNYGGGMRPPPNSLGPGMPGINMGPGAGRPWPNPNSANSIPYSSSSPGTYVGPPGGGGPPGTPIMPSPADSTNSSDNIYTMINPVPPGGSRSNFPMGPGSDGPMGGMGGMEPHHMNGSLGSGDIDGLPKNSPNNISGISNPPGTPRDDGELGGNFLHSFQNDNYSPSMTMSV
ncbi:single-stranded DNA-binding protein 3 isoform X9 [Paroedura picta]|uniref:single-stranded DNA-binding protein 3 isoform X9 n=1 Tax=Paroedura picta TaxID=143630 RepID=UPI004055B27D